jgi:hypothetical protein
MRKVTFSTVDINTHPDPLPEATKYSIYIKDLIESHKIRKLNILIRSS